MGTTSSCSCFAGDGVTDFEKMYSCTANGSIPVTKYVSKSTGLTVVHGHMAGPIVSCYICVPTRVLDDDGLPHTLEHLIFLGSKNFPYAGFLDRIANKCLASGTNAWTDMDHTCFSFCTAGNEGFCQLLPIFMDHILHPLLTDAAYKTEVYHVGGRGNDAGVIYSELLALENTGYSQAANTLFKELYPSCSGYQYNVAGKLSNLRDSTNNEKVKAFHKKFYNPRNICVIVCGKVDLSRIFRCLYSVLGKAANLGEPTTTGCLAVKPWLSDENQVIPDIPAPVEKTVKFPSYEEDGACFVTVGFLGPSVITADMKEVYALFLLLTYLTKSACAPLQQELEQNFTAENMVISLDFNAVEYSRTAFIFELNNVAAQDKGKVVAWLRKCLEKQLKNFDKKRMDDVIRSSIHAEFSITENTPHSIVAEAVIRDFLYGNNDSAIFTKRLNRVEAFKNLLQERVSFWTDLIQDKILSTNWVAIFAEPSISLMKELESQEESRISLRKQLLGTTGLFKCMQELDEAILNNSYRIPKKILRKVKVSSIKSIQHHRINRIKNPTWVSTNDFPATLCLDDISTDFIYVGLLMDTSKLQDAVRPYLPLFKEVLLSSPIRSSNSSHELISYEEVCASRDRDLLLSALNFGLELDVPEVGVLDPTASKFACGSYSHILALGLEMELNKVEEGMLWIKKILWKTHWTKDSIKVVANKMIGEALNISRDGSRISQTILKHMIYKGNSNVVNNSVITQLKVLPDLVTGDEKQLLLEPKMLAAAFVSILKVITNPNNVSLHIATDIEKLKNTLEELPSNNLGNLLKKCFPFQESIYESGRREFPNFPDTAWIMPLTQMVYETRSNTLSSQTKNQIIFGMGSTLEHSFMTMAASGPSSYLDDDLPALLTTLQYFTQQGGPLFMKLRGEGYTYSYDLVAKVNEGLIYFHLRRCTEVVGALSACLALFTEHLSHSSKIWSEDLLLSAQSSLIFECLETEKTPVSLAANSLLDYYRNVPGTFMQDLLLKIANVKIRDVKKMTKKYLDTLFHCSKDNYATVVVCPDDQAELIQQGLKQIGIQMRIVESLEDL